MPSGTLLAVLSLIPSTAPPLTATYERAAPAVVAITCESAGSPYFGTGTIIDPKGLVITSITAVPRDARRIRVYLHGGVLLPAKGLYWSAEKELAILKIDSEKHPADFAYLRLGDSEALKVGEPALTLGSAFQSIEDDDQVVLGEGVVSGLYSLSQSLSRSLSESQYRGRVIETTAHINDGMDGGALVNRDGELMGVLCLNYSRNRWLGTAVPINELKPLIASQRGWISDRQEDYPAYAGLEIEEVGGSSVRVLRVFADSPAFGAGVEAGDRVVGAQGKPVGAVKDVRETLSNLKVGDILRLEVERGGKIVPIEICLRRKSWRWI